MNPYTIAAVMLSLLVNEPTADKGVAARHAEWTILPPSQGVLVQNIMLIPPATGEPYWAPTMREVEEAEARLPKFLRQQGHAQHAKELSKYLGIMYLTNPGRNVQNRGRGGRRYFR
jgi:hypothetical protein